MDHGIFHIQCQSEDCTIAYVSREMLVTNTEVSSCPCRQAEGQVANQEPVWSPLGPHLQVCSVFT